jgi:hypothetical protein
MNLKTKISASILVLFLAAPVSVFAASAFQDDLYDNYGIDLFGFIEARQGFRLQTAPTQKDSSVSEVRGQLDMSKDLGWGEIKFKGDLIADQVLEEGRAELRELHLGFSPLDFMDVKVGRQVLTWGTGDLLFINDLFPKDWESFFTGRDDEYLKAPADAVKVSLFTDAVNLDLVWQPVFNGSVYIDGSRLNYWNGALGRTAGQDFIFGDHERNRFFDDSEISVRLSKNIEGVELALYGFRGYWKTPEGMDPVAMKLYYPELSSCGASVRSTLWGGIGNLEIGYYDSREDDDGDDPLVRNSEFRFLAGFERELARDLTGSLQYYLEWMQDYDSYRAMAGSPAKDEQRHLFTVRLTRLMMNQNLRLSLFIYYSPSDRDGYVRPRFHYKMSDNWSVEGGGNIFNGAENHTFFGQFQDNTNVYAGIRYSF